MSETFDGAAQTLEEAHDLFDWRNWEQMDSEELGRYYEKRTNHEHLRTLLQALRGAIRKERWLHALYMGPPGCGKSTDLTWWVEQVRSESALEEPLLVRHFQIGEAVGTHDVGFAEVALAMVLEIYERFEQPNMPLLSGEHLETVREWLYGDKSTTSTRSTSGQGGVDVPLLRFLKLGLSSRRVREEEVRVHLRQLLPELRQLLDALLAEVERLTGKSLLFVVDDLEKITPVDAALGLFLNHGGFFADLACHIVFTAPSALRLDPRYTPEVLKHFSESRATLARPVRDEQETQEFDALRRIIHRRMSQALIEPEAVNRIVRDTGGLVAHVIDTIERALLLAMTRGDPRVTMVHVADALKELSARYLAALRSDDYEELDRLERLGPDAHVEKPELLHSLTVLEYPDSPTEFVVHPLVLPLLERWRSGNTRGQ